MTVAVIGSREYSNYQIVKAKLDILNAYVKITKIVSGGAIGSDSLGVRYAIENNISFVEHLPDWEKHGKSAGYIRNIDIVKDANIVLAFMIGVTKGTKHSLDICSKYFINHITIDEVGNINRDISKIYRSLEKPYTWSRRVNRGDPYYEVSSRGNVAYSALYAKIKGISIEEIYQLDIKGYRGIVKHWKEVKGKPPLTSISEEESYRLYVNLWVEYFLEHPNLYTQIIEEAKDKTITDMFGVTPVNQARAICELCNTNLIKR